LASAQTTKVRADDDRTQAARSLDDRAVTAYLRGDFQLAVKLLLEAERLAPEQPAIFINQGKAYEALRDRASAIRAYRRYLALAPDAPAHAAVAQHVDNLEHELAEAASVQRQLEEERRRREIEHASRPVDKRLPILPWVVTGTGAASLSAGVVMGLLALSEHGAASRATTGTDASQHQDSARSFATAANVLFIAGGALVPLGIIWVLVKPSSSPPPPLAGTF
jgi:tetratricopeptide (TPR) repeat protein